MSDLDQILSDEEIKDEDFEEEEEAQPEDEATGEVEEPAEPEVAEEPEPKDDPREKEIAGLKAALAEARANVREAKSRPAPEPQKKPDFIDPEGADYFQQQIQVMQANMAAELSEAKARARYGDADVDAAFAAAEKAGEIENFVGKPDAWGQLVKWHKRETVLSEVGDDPDAYRQRIRAEVEAELKAKAVAANVAGAGKAPSLAKSPNLGSRSAPEWSGPPSLDEILG